MGALLTLLQKQDVAQVFFDFENAEPTDGELETYNMTAQILQRGLVVLKEIEDYKGCQDLARKAMANASRENEEEALDGLIISVRAIKHFYQFALDLEHCTLVLLQTLSAPQRGQEEKELQQSALQNQQALVKQLASLFDFALLFDQTRMLRPHLSNDFAYYRRLLPKFSKSPKVEVREDEANAMAMFTAEHIPMISAVRKACVQAAQQNQLVYTVLSTMANSCCFMLKNKKFAAERTNLLCARAMAGSIVCYDHAHMLGVFHKKSPVDVKGCVTVLKRDFAREQALLNAIRFSSKHFNDASTPASLAALFE